MPILPTKTSLIAIDAILEKGNIQEGSRAADLGCGRSIFFLYALSTLVGPAGKVFGIDILPEALDSATRDVKHHSLSTISILQGNLETERGVPLNDGTISSAFLINTLSQASDTIAMLRESARILNENGRLVIVDWLPSESPFGPDMRHRLSSDDLLKALDVSGLKVLDQFEAGPYHYGAVVIKQS